MTFYESIANYYLDCQNFKGRSSRKQYLYVVLYCTCLSITGIAFFGLFGEKTQNIFSAIYTVVHLIPSAALIVRRLHDTNKSGWYYLIILTLVGIIPVLYALILKKGDSHANKFGEPPEPEDKASPSEVTSS